MCVSDSVESVNDGLFHTVELLLQNRSLSLVVDRGAPKSLGKLARQPSVDHNTQLYIGGRYTQKPQEELQYVAADQSIHHVFNWSFSPSFPSLFSSFSPGVPSQVAASGLRPSPDRPPQAFNGCIHNVRINGEPQDLNYRAAGGGRHQGLEGKVIT